MISPPLPLADAAAVITAIGAAIAATLAGTATLIAALNRRDVRKTREQTAPTNGASLSTEISQSRNEAHDVRGEILDRVEKLTAELAEQRPLIEWARLRRAQELGAPATPTPDDVHKAESQLHRGIG